MGNPKNQQQKTQPPKPKPNNRQEPNRAQQQQPQQPLSRIEKQKIKKETVEEKWRLKLTYHEPHATYDVTKVSIEDIVIGIRKVCKYGVDGKKFIFLKDVEFFVIRLQTSDEEEDGLLTYWRREDLYFLIVGVKNHGLYQLGDEWIIGAKIIGGVSYKDMGGRDIRVGAAYFEDTVVRLIGDIKHHKEKFSTWMPLIESLVVYLPESVRDDVILYAVTKDFGVDYLCHPCMGLIQNWKTFSVVGYRFNIQPGYKITEEDNATIERLKNPGPLTEKENRDLIASLKTEFKVCHIILRIPWDYNAINRYKDYILDELSKNPISVDAIQKALKEKVKNYEVPRCQLKHILWNMFLDGLVIYEQGNYKQLPKKSTKKGKQRRSRNDELAASGSHGSENSNVSEDIPSLATTPPSEPQQQQRPSRHASSSAAAAAQSSHIGPTMGGNVESK